MLLGDSRGQRVEFKAQRDRIAVRISWPEEL